MRAVTVGHGAQPARSSRPRSRTPEWRAALEDAVTRPALKPGHSEPHRPWEPISELRDGVLRLCGRPVA